MNLLHNITSSLRIALLALVLGVAGTGGLASVAHASGQMDMMNECARVCALQQSPAAITPEQHELEERDDKAEPQKASPTAVPYYVQFQRNYIPQKLTANDPVLLSSFRPPDLVLRNGTLRF